MRKIFAAALVLPLLVSCSTRKKIDPAQENLIYRNPPISPESAAVSAASLATQLEEKIKGADLYRYPEITLEFVVKDSAKAARLVKAAGGRVLYDPNLGVGGQIPFLVVTLPPEKAADKAFIGSLELDSARVLLKSEEDRLIPFERLAGSPGGSRNLYVPWDDIKLPELRARKQGEGLGEGVKIAVIDSGVDASHPAMEDRVVYWADHTQETRTPLTEAKAEGGKLAITKDLQVNVPEGLDPAAPLFAGLIDEQSLVAQLGEEERNKAHPGLDLNRNGSTEDTFPVLVGKEKASGLWVAYVGATGDGITPAELARPIADFNDIRAARACRGESVPDRDVFLDFPARNRKLSYPVLIERESGVPTYLSLGIDFGDHGTHVAGIAAGHGLGVEGAAPKAQVMALKVCAGEGCRTEAILRGLVDAFYNPYGCVPDVVNISLGSLLRGAISSRDMLIRDLASKFGATFFLAAGNDGPGYRTIMAMGATGPAVIVGAHISRNSFQRHYNAGSSSGLPENMMFFFSSSGPTFTGLLRPHIAAPGSALSSIPLADGGFEMMQGTSMASPIAAGSAAALLSLAKKAPEYEKYGKLREKKIHQVLHPGASWEEPISLQQFPLALRASLEEGAYRLPDFTDPQQGFGLMNVNSAYDLFLQKLKNIDRALFSEYAVNNNKNENTLYDRSPDLAPVKVMQLRLIEDKEAPEQDMVSLRGSDLQVKLDYVEVQDTQGHVQRLTDKLPFALVQPGDQEQEGTAATLVLANSSANIFRSLRKLDRMEPGKSYFAHYSLAREGQVVDTLVDVVHNPFTLGDGTSTYDDLSALSAVPIQKTAAFVRKAQTIKATEVHRYPIALTSRDQGLSVKLGIPAGMNGVIYLRVYGPDGRKLMERAASRQPGLVEPVVSGYAETEGKPGIYEVTVSATNGRWLSDSRYDLLAVADRLRVAREPVSLATGAAKSSLPHEAVVTLVNSSRQVKQVEARIEGVSRMEYLADVKLVPQSWTFRRVHLPEKTGDIDATRVTILFGDKLMAAGNLNARIDSHLYALAEDGETFTPVYAAEGESAAQEKKTFSHVKLDRRELYVAVETLGILPNGKEDATGDLDVIYEDVPVEGANGLKAEVSRDGSENAFLVRVRAPGQLSLPVAEKAVPVLRAKLSITRKGAENERPFVVPVTVSQ